MKLPALDSLSPAAREVLELAASSAAFGKLVIFHATTEEDSELAPARRRLETLPSVHDLFARPVAREDEARCVLAGLWLLLDELDRSHQLAQGIPSTSGSFWHAIMHRREGDFSNSRYWYARCADHPALVPIGRRAAAVVEGSNDLLVQRTCPGGVWKGTGIVDLVEAVHDRSDARRVMAVELQRIEWSGLMDWCTRAAIGDESPPQQPRRGGGAG